MKKILTVLALVLLGTGTLKAQIVGGHAYMLGDYVEIGIHQNGHEGAPCPGDSVHCRSTPVTDLLGFVANPQMDGWVDYNGDFFGPGSPECGFGLTYTLLGITVRANNNGSGALSDISGSVTDYTETTDSITVTWIGTTDDLELTIWYKLKKDELFYTTEMSISNLGVETYTDVYYFHNFDPDNNQPIGGTFTTENTLVKQSGMADDSVEVSATQDYPWISEVILHAYGSDWKGYHGGFSNRNGAELWSGTGVNLTEGSSVLADQAIGLVHHIPSIEPGKSSGEKFGFITAFDADINLSGSGGSGGVGITENQLNVDVYPNPVNDGLLNLQLLGTYNYTITDLKGSVVLNGTAKDKKSLDISTVENGMYLLKVEQDGKVFTDKIVVNL